LTAVVEVVEVVVVVVMVAKIVHVDATLGPDMEREKRHVLVSLVLAPVMAEVVCYMGHQDHGHSQNEGIFFCNHRKIPIGFLSPYPLLLTALP
jgi:hypothetical protein